MKTKCLFAGLLAIIATAMGFSPATAVDFTVALTNSTPGGHDPAHQ